MAPGGAPLAQGGSGGALAGLPAAAHSATGGSDPAIAGAGSAAGGGGSVVVGGSSTAGANAANALGVGCAKSLSTVTLGNVGTYSGVIGALTKTALPALQVWAKYTNAHGGLNCHPVRVISADDGGDPSTAESETERMVSQDHAIAFINNETFTEQATVGYLEQHHIPVIGGGASDQVWWQSPVYFPQTAYYLRSADDLISMAAKEGHTKVGLIYCIEVASCQDFKGYVQTHAGADGGSLVYVSSASLTQPSFTAQCIEAKNAGANFILLIVDGNSAERFARDCVAQDYHPTYGMPSITFTTDIASDSQLNGLLVGAMDFPWTDHYTPLQESYQQAVQEYDPNMTQSGATTYAWASGELVVAASKYLTTNPTSAELFQGLWTIKNNDIGGVAPPLTFNKNAPASLGSCYFNLVLQNGQFVDPNHGKYVC